MSFSLVLKTYSNGFCVFFFDQATFLTLWAGSVFNTRPRCEDPSQGEGSTLVWCDVLSATVGSVDIVVIAAIGVCFVYIKAKSMSIETGEDEVVPVGSGKKKRRLSSRELMVEMSSHHLQSNALATEEGEVKNGEGGEEGEEVIVTLGVNPMHVTRGGTAATAPETVTPNAARGRWNKLKQTTRTSRMFRNGGKQRMKRLSKVIKARQNESGGGGGDLIGGEAEMKTELDTEVVVSMHVDAETGRRYSYNKATGQTQWLSDEVEKDEATIEKQGDSKQRNMKRQSFRKIVGDNNAVFFQNVETGETVWNRPVDSELVL